MILNYFNLIYKKVSHLKLAQDCTMSTLTCVCSSNGTQEISGTSRPGTSISVVLLD